jgi:protocatechuate 3,4-dioxygenase beta subunit
LASSNKMRRRDVLKGAAACVVVSCGPRAADWCESPQLTDDGDFPAPDSCQTTAADIEGPYYIESAPEREDLTTFGDEGTMMTFSGTVYESGCAAGLEGAVVEFWHADPAGSYDNKSEEMRYRCRITTDETGFYQLKTLLPGRYTNGSTLRPQHIHVKVFDADKLERLTTQLYVEGDPYIECDPFASSSLVIPFAGSESTSLTAENVDFVLI